jgi:elongation factor P
MATTSDVRIGTTLRYNGELCTVFEWEHRTPGNLRAFYQAKLKSMKSGKMLENRFRSGEEVEIVRVERKKYQYLYHDGDTFVFMDQQTFDQINVAAEILGESAKFMKESEVIDILFTESNEIIFAELPITVTLKVEHTDPGVRGDTATGGSKPATLETGAMVNVPLFLNEGDYIRVDTRTGEYLERVKQN